MNLKQEKKVVKDKRLSFALSNAELKTLDKIAATNFASKGHVIRYALWKTFTSEFEKFAKMDG